MRSERGLKAKIILHLFIEKDPNAMFTYNPLLAG